jgi:hypothetical protein
LGYVWRGRSKLDGGPVAAVLNKLDGSENSKTGPMSILTMFRADRHPMDAVNDGTDATICGGCALRKNPETGRRLCNVVLAKMPCSVWGALKRDRYEDLGKRPLAKLRQLGAIRPPRLGFYGDPAALPTWFSRELTSRAKLWTGYTHQWRTCDPELGRYLMASCNGPEDREEAWSRGLRTYTLLHARSSVR